jgi:hypothetical protein
MATLDLPRLSQGFPGMTPAFGACLAEAASVSFEERGHQSGVMMSVDGDRPSGFNIAWASTDDQMRRCWSDEQVATEHGAYGIAALLVEALTPYTIVQRSRKGTGFDWWLDDRASPPQPLFQGKSRLEVSGIRVGTDAVFSGRVQQKLTQIGSANGRTPGLVVVVEFGAPRSRMRSAP